MLERNTHRDAGIAGVRVACVSALVVCQKQLSEAAIVKARIHRRVAQTINLKIKRC
jgi:hypothetical protein